MGRRPCLRFGKETFVLLRVAEYERLREQEYDDSPWTREELEALAWEAVKHRRPIQNRRLDKQIVAGTMIPAGRAEVPHGEED
jgi:hypothetical protein